MIKNSRDKIAIGLFVAFYVIFGIFLTFNQERVVYQPSTQDFESCLAFTDAQKITHKGTRMYVAAVNSTVVVLYHGNGGSACDRSFLANAIKQAGYGYIVPEYAGYSNAPEETTHALVKKDVENVISYLEERKFSEVVIIGESIGTGIASYHTLLSEPSKLLLISPFNSLQGVARRKFWFYPTSILVDNAFDNVDLLKNFTSSVTIIHGESDKLISPVLSRRLYERLRTTDKNYIVIPNVGHNDLFSSPDSFDRLRAFLISK